MAAVQSSRYSKKLSQKIPQKFLGVQNRFFKKGFAPRSASPPLTTEGTLLV